MRTTSGDDGRRGLAAGRGLLRAVGLVWAGLACSGWIAAGGCAGPGARAAGSGADPAAQAAVLLTGSFSSAEQAAADPENFRDIRLRSARIWPSREDGVWLYVEQASASALDRPYRQRVYRLTAEGGGVVRSRVFTLPGDPLRFVGAWRDPALLEGLAPEMLSLRDGCDVVLERVGPGRFRGSTEGTGCASELRGASYATSIVEAWPDRLETWDRGFDASGAQVWGSTAGGYVFRRVGEGLQ